MIDFQKNIPLNIKKIKLISDDPYGLLEMTIKEILYLYNIDVVNFHDYQKYKDNIPVIKIINIFYDDKIISNDYYGNGIEKELTLTVIINLIFPNKINYLLKIFETSNLFNDEFDSFKKDIKEELLKKELCKNVGHHLFRKLLLIHENS
ncbi:MAG: hypothetical protein RA161_02070 [Arsenophonus sp.]|nr:MAG: hypothetical protein RA161_02070 [Arsenophonus sp.]